MLDNVELDNNDFVLISMMILMLCGPFLWMVGMGLIYSPIIIGSAMTIFGIFIVVTWSLKRYFEIREIELKPDANEILARKYANGDITEVELEKKDG